MGRESLSSGKVLLQRCQNMEDDFPVIERWTGFFDEVSLEQFSTLPLRRGVHRTGGLS
jgi:hypothetical protein